MKKTIISIKNLSVTFLVKKQFLTAIKNIDFDIYQNETLAIVGESGSGKTVLTRMLTNLNEANGYASNGSITYFGTMPKCIKGQ
jgi:oligopeptide transport system ATP-binding protein